MAVAMGLMWAERDVGGVFESLETLVPVVSSHSWKIFPPCRLMPSLDPSMKLHYPVA